MSSSDVVEPFSADAWKTRGPALSSVFSFNFFDPNSLEEEPLEKLKQKNQERQGPSTSLDEYRFGDQHSPVVRPSNYDAARCRPSSPSPTPSSDLLPETSSEGSSSSFS